MEIMRCYYISNKEIMAYSRGYNQRFNVQLEIVENKNAVYFVDEKGNDYTVLQILKEMVSDKIDFIEIIYKTRGFDVMAYVRKKTIKSRTIEDGKYEKEICTV